MKNNNGSSLYDLFQRCSIFVQHTFCRIRSINSVRAVFGIFINLTCQLSFDIQLLSNPFLDYMKNGLLRIFYSQRQSPTCTICLFDLSVVKTPFLVIPGTRSINVSVIFPQSNIQKLFLDWKKSGSIHSQ